MKLSELQNIVHAMTLDRHVDNADPEVNFWLRGDVKDAVKSSRAPFIECVPEATSFAREHRTAKGDFSWPLELAS